MLYPLSATIFSLTGFYGQVLQRPIKKDVVIDICLILSASFCTKKAKNDLHDTFFIKILNKKT